MLFRPLKVLAVCGSLRASSSNRAALDAAARLAPDGLSISIYEGLGALPHFNPDLDGEASVPPATVVDLRARVAESDGMLISTPEYAHGLPGSFKNMLDWLVSAEAFYGKPIAVINATPGPTTFAADSLDEILRTMSARLVTPAYVTLPLRGRRMDGAAVAADGALADALRGALERFARALREPSNEAPVLPSP